MEDGPVGRARGGATFQAWCNNLLHQGQKWGQTHPRSRETEKVTELGKPIKHGKSDVARAARLSVAPMMDWMG